MSKAVEDSVYLYEFLMDKKIEHQSFESVSVLIQKKFSKSEYLSVGTLLTILIRHGDLPGILQKTTALYVIYDLFRSDGQLETPFLSFFVDLLEQPPQSATRLTVIERNFLLQLLKNGTKVFAKQTPGTMLKSSLPAIPIDIEGLKREVAEKQRQLPATVRAGVMNIIPAPTAELTAAPSIRDLMENLLLSENTPLKNTFSPQVMFVAPPLLSAFDDELVWLDLTNPAFHKPAYDSSTNIGVEAKRLMERAFKQTLTLQEQQTLLDELKKDPNLVYQIGLTPAKLPDLVENNPLVSIEILLKLMNSNQITEYFNVLVNMKITLHSMEVVNR